ncbi:MAG: metal-dependent transcriptional regulator [Bacillota bacterium]|nr:metal-dependent transcriptional regulator [Bacillota bacterium]
MSIRPSSENYLEVIYNLSDNTDKTVRSVDIARKLNISRASVNKAIGVLKAQGLVDHEHYGDIRLTENGLESAKKVLSRHKLLKSFLINVLHVAEGTAENDACLMEHVLSEETISKWENYMKQFDNNHQ